MGKHLKHEIAKSLRIQRSSDETMGGTALHQSLLRSSHRCRTSSGFPLVERLLCSMASFGHQQMNFAMVRSSVHEGCRQQPRCHILCESSSQRHDRSFIQRPVPMALPALRHTFRRLVLQTCRPRAILSRQVCQCFRQANAHAPVWLGSRRSHSVLPARGLDCLYVHCTC